MNKNNLYLLAVAAAIMTACTSDIVTEKIKNRNECDIDAPMPLLFSMKENSIFDITRSTTSIVTFNANEAIKVFARPNVTGAVYTEYDYVTDAQGQTVDLTLTKNHTTNDATPPYFPAGLNTSIDVYAYYPADAGTTFTVADDQTGDSEYKASDLMYSRLTATKTVIVQEQTAQLAMSHQMAQLRIQAKAEGLTIKRVLVNGYKSVHFNPSAENLADVSVTTGSKGDIIAFEDAEGCNDTGDLFILIPSQQINDVYIKVQTDDGSNPEKSGTFVFSSTNLYEAGHTYGLDLTIDATKLGHSTLIADWQGNTSVTYVPTGDLIIDPIAPRLYDGTAYTPEITVKNDDGTVTLTKDIHYTVEYLNNIHAGTGLVIVKGIGTEYAGKAAVGLFHIIPVDISQATIDDIPDCTYNRSAWTPGLTITNALGTLVLNKDYTVVYSDNIDAGTATATVTGTGNYAGSSTTKTFTILPKSLTTASSDFVITLENTSMPFTGSSISNSVTSVTDEGVAMTAGTDYTVSGETSGTNVKADYTITVAGTGNYEGEKTATWAITKSVAAISTAPEAYTLTYTGSPQNLVSAGETNGGTIFYASTSVATKPEKYAITSETVPQQTNANTYYVWYYIKGDANHTDSEVNDTPITVTINKKTISDWSIGPSTMNLATAGASTGDIAINWGAGSSDDHGAITYVSNATSVATVSSGTVTAIDQGSATITVSIADGANYIYDGSKTVPVSVTCTLLASATADDVKRIICSRGHIHNTVAEVRCSGGEAVAMIAYVGSAGSVEYNNNSYRGLAIALSDANGGSTCAWCNKNTEACLQTRYNARQYSTVAHVITGIASTNELINHTSHIHSAAQAAVSNNGKTAPTGTSGWILPSMGQWNLMLTSLKGGTEVPSEIGDSKYSDVGVNPILPEGVGGLVHSTYWTSTEVYDTEQSHIYDLATSFRAYSGKVGNDIKNSGGNYVRSFLAF